MRWANRLLQYNFRVKHFFGKSNTVADMLTTHFAADTTSVSNDFDDTEKLLKVFNNSQLAPVISKNNYQQQPSTMSRSI